MPPLNRFLEDQENTVWRLENQSHEGVSSHGGLESPSKPRNALAEEISSSERRARFSEENQLHAIIRRKDYSEQEILDCWYTAQEYASFRHDISTTVCLHKIDNTRIDDMEYTMRGVEHRVKEASCRRCSIRSSAKSVVLLEQDLQDGLGELNVEYIAATYADVARASVYEALNLAALDRLDTFRYQNEHVLEEFNDDWISSISTPIGDSAINGGPHMADRGSEEDLQGFDDLWLRDIFVNS